MDKTKFTNLLVMAKAHARLADMDVQEVLGPWPMPLRNVLTRKDYLGVGFVARVFDRVKNEAFTTTIAVSVSDNGEADFKLACPSTMLVTGGISRSAIDAVADKLSEGMAQPESLAQSVNELYGRYALNDACDYQALARNDRLCGHLAAALAHLQTMHTDLPAILENRYAEVVSGGPGGKPLAGQESDGLEEIERYAFRVPVLLEGDRGGGKTHDAYALGRKHGYPVVLMPGHDGVEPADMLGYTVQAGAHGFVWMDGPVTAAFRKAQSGKVILLIDELLRIPQRQLSALLTALTPDHHAGVYRLPTGRIIDVVDDVAQAEVLTCPLDNICVIATTNVGGEYAVDESDPALRERFHVIRRDTEESRLRRILTTMLAERAWPETLLVSMMSFFDAMSVLQSQGNLKSAPTTRLMTRALLLARTPKEVGTVLFEMNLQWTARGPNGRPSVEQQELVRKAVNKAFGLSIPEVKAKKK